MSKSFIQFCAMALLVSQALCLTLTAGSAAWQEPAHAWRISLRLPASAGEPMTVPVMMTGREFFQLSGFPRPRLDSFRLRGVGGEINLQAEEYDQDGNLSGSKDGRLDDSDLILFTARLDNEPQTLYLYCDGPAKIAPSGKGAGVEVTVLEGKPIPLELRSGDLLIGVRGGGEPPFDNKQINHGRGAIAKWLWKGTPFTDMAKGWTNYFPHCVGAGPGAPAWTAPKVVVQGGVRVIVELECKGVTVKDGDKEVLKGDVLRRIAVWAGCPVVDFEEVVRYTASGFEHSWQYGQAIPLGKALDAADRLVVPVGGSPYVVDFGKELDAANPLRRLYETSNPEEGWLAVQDGLERIGLAVFYERLAPIRERDDWLTYRPAMHPEVNVRQSAGECLALRLSFRDRALRCRSEMRRPLRYVALASETPAAIRQQYAFWCGADEAGVLVGAPEPRP